MWKNYLFVKWYLYIDETATWNASLYNIKNKTVSTEFPNGLSHCFFGDLYTCTEGNISINLNGQYIILKIHTIYIYTCWRVESKVKIE